jgi:hypothetical protein
MRYYPLTCGACGHTWQSRSVGGHTRCGACRARTYVPLATRQQALGVALSQRQIEDSAIRRQLNQVSTPPTIQAPAPRRTTPRSSPDRAPVSVGVRAQGPTWLDLGVQLAGILATNVVASVVPETHATRQSLPFPQGEVGTGHVFTGAKCQCGLTDPCPLLGCVHPSARAETVFE